jgi:putative phage-type endonuclease
MPRLSPAELSVRRLGLGSTDIVEANGLAPWRGAGPMRLYCEKLGLKPPDDAEEHDDEAQWLEWGHVQEPVIADWYERERGCKLMLGGQVQCTEHPFLWCTLDRKVIDAPRLIEVKNVGSPQLYRHWDTSSDDGVPQYVRAQVTVAMAFHGARECDVVASVGGRPPQVWRVFYDEELSELLIAGAVLFWGLVQRNEPPALDHTPASKEYLRARYPEQRDRVLLDADGETDLLGQRREEAARLELTHRREKDRLDAELLSRVGEHDGIQGTGWRMTWRADKHGVRRQRFTAGREVE